MSSKGFTDTAPALAVAKFPSQSKLLPQGTTRVLNRLSERRKFPNIPIFGTVNRSLGRGHPTAPPLHCRLVKAGERPHP